MEINSGSFLTPPEFGSGSQETIPPALPSPKTKSPFERLIALVVRICMSVVVVYLAINAFALGSRRGWASPAMMLDVIHHMISFILFGTFAVAALGLIAVVLRRYGRATRKPPWTAEHEGSAESAEAAASTPAITANLERELRRRNWPRRFAIRVLVALAVCFGTGAYLGWVVDAKLAEATAAADRDDPNWRAKDLIAGRSAVPDAENSGPVVLKAAAMLPILPPSAPPPQDGGPAQQILDARKQMRDQLKAVPHNVEPSQSLVATLRRLVQTNVGAVQLCRSLANYQRGHYQIALGKRIVDTPLAHLHTVRAIADVLVADSAIRSLDGDADGATDSCCAIVGTARSIGDEPFMVSQLVRELIDVFAVQAAQRVLGQGQPSDAALARLQRALSDELGEPLLIYAMRGERLGLVEPIRQIGAGEVTIAELAKAQTAEPNGDRPVLVAPWAKLWYDYQQAVALEWMNEAMADARAPLPTQRKRWEELEAEINRRSNTTLSRYAALMPVLLFPNLTSGFFAFMHEQSELGAMVIVLAAERHHLKTGNWPASIGAIDKSLLATEPLDPFSNKSFCMEFKDGKLKIYSIGPNRKDEHGEFDAKLHTKGILDDFGVSGWDLRLRHQPPAKEADVGQ
jgi:hypothetical protein